MGGSGVKLVSGDLKQGSLQPGRPSRKCSDFPRRRHLTPRKQIESKELTMPPKKAAKKSAKHHDDQHHHSKDLRRAYEHLGRVEILRQTLSGAGDEIAVLVKLAQEEVANDAPKNAADLLRAAEHLSFAAILNRGAGEAEPFPDLAVAIRGELGRLAAKAEEHWEAESADPKVEKIYRDSLKKAGIARDQGAYRQALELARGAEALAHVKTGETKNHPKKKAPKKLAASSNVRELAAS